MSMCFDGCVIIYCSWQSSWWQSLFDWHDISISANTSSDTISPKTSVQTITRVGGNVNPKVYVINYLSFIEIPGSIRSFESATWNFYTLEHLNEYLKYLDN